MTARIVEGTWEEIAARAPEFAGRKVRLVVLPEMKAVPITRGEPGNLLPLIERAFTDLGVDVTQPALTAEEVQQLMVREGVSPADNLGSRAIIEARED